MEHRQRSSSSSSSSSLGSSFNTDRATEDDGKLRERTAELLRMLAESRHDAVAVITHKAFLRGLERGPFRQDDAVEFRNCEVRVYSTGLPSSRPAEANVWKASCASNRNIE